MTSCQPPHTTVSFTPHSTANPAQTSPATLSHRAQWTPSNSTFASPPNLHRLIGFTSGLGTRSLAEPASSRWGRGASLALAPGAIVVLFNTEDNPQPGRLSLRPHCFHTPKQHSPSTALVSSSWLQCLFETEAMRSLLLGLRSRPLCGLHPIGHRPTPQIGRARGKGLGTITAEPPRRSRGEALSRKCRMISGMTLHGPVVDSGRRYGKQGKAT